MGEDLTSSGDDELPVPECGMKMFRRRKMDVACRHTSLFPTVRYNDIEFSGERKRVRCNELLAGRDADWSRAAGTCSVQVGSGTWLEQVRPKR